MLISGNHASNIGTREPHMAYNKVALVRIRIMTSTTNSVNLLDFSTQLFK